MHSVFANIRGDFRQAARAVVRSRRFSLPAIVMLALSIGAAITIFSVAYAAVLRPLPFPESEDLVVLWEHDDRSRADQTLTGAAFSTWQERSDSFAHMAVAEYWNTTEALTGQAVRRRGVHVSGELFEMLGVAPRIGRYLMPADSAPGATPVVVINEALWQERFGGSPGALGQPMRLDGAPYEVVGVMPASFRFPTFWATDRELWAPITESAAWKQSGTRSLRAFARLAEGVSTEQAADELSRIVAGQAEEFPNLYRDRSANVETLHQVTVRGATPIMVAIGSGVALLLILGCGNLAGLLILRGLRRQHELAVRAAMGAGRGRIAGQLLAEGVILAMAGALAGVVLASWSLDAIYASIPAQRDYAVFQAAAAAPRAALLWITIGVALVSACLFSVLPAWYAARVAGPSALRSREQTQSHAARRLGQVVVAGELALAFILMVGALLAARSWDNLRHVDPGFRPERLIAAALPVTGTRSAEPGQKEQFYRAVLERTRNTPGVASASLVNHIPLRGDVWTFSVAIDGVEPENPARAPSAAFRVAEPEYFATLGAKLLAGRDFAEADAAQAEPVAIVNESFASRYWPGQTAIGRRVRIGGQDSPWRTVVGVVADLRQQDWRSAEDAVFVPFAQDPMFRDNAGGPFAMTLVVRATQDVAPLVEQIRRHVSELDPYVPMGDVTVLTEAVEVTLFQPLWTARLLVGFGVSGLLLAAIGIYTLIAFHTAQRRREFGIRLALGASPARLRQGVFREGFGLLALGLAAGAAAAVAVTSAWSSWLYGIQPTDTTVWAAAVAALALTALVAVDGPARRAAKTSAASALQAGD